MCSANGSGFHTGAPKLFAPHLLPESVHVPLYTTRVYASTGAVDPEGLKE
jgi:hypothetical protein